MSVRAEVSPAEYLQMMRESSVYDVAQRTPLDAASLLSARTANRVWLKREDLQPVFSFKLRGAYAHMSRLSRAVLEKGVIAASAGNHAQGVALAARRLGVSATIVVPVTTPAIKTEAILALGATLILHGDAYDDAYQHARKLSDEQCLYFVHPYDHPEVIAGQGTIGLELIEQLSTIHSVFVPVGGGGLIAGIALAMKQQDPSIRVVGVEPEDSDAMHRSLALGRRVTLERVGALADGVAVRTVGEETFRICQEWVDEVVTVSNDAICAAVKEIFEDRRAILEPSGALAFAGLKKVATRDGLTGCDLVAICSGANLDFDRLRYISERSDVGQQREAIFAMHLPERPGEFRVLCSAFGNRSITEFNYRMGDPERATVFVGVRLSGGDPLGRERGELLEDLVTRGYDAVDLTEDELTKTHMRHMVGGRCPEALDERLFQFDFPERPGALLRFLDHVARKWNISLFHYRNHGSDRGRVLVGFQVPASTAGDFARFLDNLAYPFSEETESDSARLFLS
jgi:threonine dehydratase